MVENEADTIDTQGSDVEEDEEEGASIEDEFRSLFAEAESESKRLKGLAMKAEQVGDNSAATVLREVAGGPLQLIQELIATCGGAFADIEAASEDEGSRLETDDAEKLHGLLTACRKLVTEVLSAGGASGEGREGLETLLKLIDDQMEFVLDVSDFEPQPIATAASPAN